MTIKNVNVYPAQGKTITDVIPNIVRVTKNIDLPLNYIHKILISGHKVEENVEGKIVLLNLVNYDQDNSKDQTYSLAINPNSVNVDTELEKKYNDLVDEKTLLESEVSDLQNKVSTLTKSVDTKTSELATLQKSVSDKDAQITTLQKSNTDKDAQIKSLQEQLAGTTSTK